MRKLTISLLLSVCTSTLLFAQKAPLGEPSRVGRSEQKALEKIEGKINGFIVWSTSRANQSHDIWIMDADGNNKRAITNSSNNVDWFPRISPDGSKILFTRSILPWVREQEAEVYSKWSIWMVNRDGSGEEKVIDTASWAVWHADGDSIVFAREGKVFVKSKDADEEHLIFDAEKHFDKKGVYAQQPSISPDGKFITMTIRGRKRMTGIYNRDTEEWYETKGGCEIIWFPDGKSVVRANQGTGNGGTELLRINIDTNSGEPVEDLGGLRISKEIKFMDLPGRRSHEYFPKVGNKGKWLVWGATRIGHEHDIADYEIYIWDIEKEQDEAVRLTFHSANDRWPDIYVEE